MGQRYPAIGRPGAALGSMSCRSLRFTRHSQDDRHHQCGRGALHCSLHKIIKTRGSFPNDDAALFDDANATIRDYGLER
jgi:hypothetical protein